MSLVDVEIAFFIPLVFALYWLMPRRVSAQNLVLLLASWVFYIAWNWKWLWLVVAGGLLDFLLAKLVEANRSDSRVGTRRAALVVSLCWNLGALAYFKYANFFLESVYGLLHVFGGQQAFSGLAIVLPLGISFYTLQRVSYIIDVYQGRERACNSLLNFMLFAGYFPQLTAGPIARASELLHQLEKPRKLLASNIARAGGEILLGFALKAWIADTISKVVGPVFDSPTSWSVLSHWIALIGYAVEIFGDFAGYSLIAIGISRLFGIELPMNFNLPFLSRNLMEFWRRWHITLNRWLFDYIYGPMTISRGWFRGRMDVALLITFLASGLWHGAAMTFVLWGFMHGIGMIVHRRWDETYRGWCRQNRRFVEYRRGFIYSLLAWLLTQSFFLFSLIPFRAQKIGSVWEFAHGLWSSTGVETVHTGLSVLLGFGVLIGYHLTGMQKIGALWDRFLTLPAPVRGIAYGLFFVFLMLFVPVGESTFIYRQF